MISDYKHLFAGCFLMAFSFVCASTLWSDQNLQTEITYYGLFCFSIKDSNNRITLTDPFDASEVGLSTHTVRPNTVIITHAQTKKKLIEIVKPPFQILNSYGNYRIMGILYNGIMTSKLNNMYLWDMDGIRFLHMGNLTQNKFNDGTLKKLQSIDVVFFPIGGYFKNRSDEIWDLISILQPSIVIPMYYQLPELPESFTLGNLDDFIQSYEGIIKNIGDRTLRINKENLPDQITIYILSHKEAEIPEATEKVIEELEENEIKEEE
ncbi:MAG: MBL fold metallo-hydrolase [bacterium]